MHTHTRLLDRLLLSRAAEYVRRMILCLIVLSPSPMWDGSLARGTRRIRVFCLLHDALADQMYDAVERKSSTCACDPWGDASMCPLHENPTKHPEDCTCGSIGCDIWW